MAPGIEYLEEKLKWLKGPEKKHLHDFSNFLSEEILLPIVRNTIQ